MDQVAESNLTVPPRRSAAAILDGMRTGDGPVLPARMHSYRTGFDPLDRLLEGGIRPHDLILVGGVPGVGKTVLAMQWARQMALDGRTVVFVCYEHEEHVLLQRLLSLELGMIAGADDVTELGELRSLIVELTEGRKDLSELLVDRPLLALAIEAFEQYADRLLLIRGSGAGTGLPELATMVSDVEGDPVLFVDYLQKVAVQPEPETEGDKVRRVAEGLKDLALSYEIPVVAVVAADFDGLTARRLRLHHLRGSSALAYECDVAVLLNDKFRSVAKRHLAYDPVKAETFKQWAVATIEKNRGGLAMVDTEFRKDFAHYRFDPVGRHLAETLVDERFDEA